MSGTNAVDDGLVAGLVARAQAGGVELTGEGGLLRHLTKRVLESALEGELTDHLGHEPGERAEGGRENYRNGHRPKTVITESGPGRDGPVAVGERADARGDRHSAVETPDGPPVTATLLFYSRERKALNRNYFNMYLWEPALIAGGVIPERAPEKRFKPSREHGSRDRARRAIDSVFGKGVSPGS